MDLQSDIVWSGRIPKNSSLLNPRQKIHIDAVCSHPVFHRKISNMEPWVIVCTVKRDHPKWEKVQNMISGLTRDEKIDEEHVVVDCDNGNTDLVKNSVYVVNLGGGEAGLTFKNKNSVERWVFDMIACDVLRVARGLIVYANSVKNVPASWLLSSPVGFCAIGVDDPNEILLKGFGQPFDAIDDSSVKSDDVIGWVKGIENSRITKF